MATKAHCAWNFIAVLKTCEWARRVSNSPADHLVVQKSLFLNELQGRTKDLKVAYYRFFRYNNGPYSSGLHWDLDKLQQQGFIDSETGDVLERGQYLLDYVNPALDADPLTPTFNGVIQHVAEGWKDYRGWSIAERVYDLKVPVDALGGQMMRVADISPKIDILIPEQSSARDFSPFSPDLVEDIYAELSIPLSRLDPLSEELRHSGAEALEAALARS